MNSTFSDVIENDYQSIEKKGGMECFLNILSLEIFFYKGINIKSNFAKMTLNVL